MRLIELRAENFKRLSAVRVAPTGPVTPIVGRNGAGKTSVLDAVAAALGGATQAPELPIRRGADAAEIVADLGDVVVRRRWTAKGSTLEVTARDGAKYASPQAVLDRLVGELSFDPLAFTRLRPADQAALLARVAGVDLDAHAAKRKEMFDARTALNRAVKDRKAQLAGMPVFDAPAEELKLVDLLNRIAEAQSHNAACSSLKSAVLFCEREAAAARQRVGGLEIELQRAKKDLSAAEKKAEKAKTAADAQQPIDVDPLHAEAKAAEETNRLVRAAKMRAKLEAEVAGQEQAAADLSDRLRSLDAGLEDAVAKAPLPIPGLALGTGGVMLDGIPFGQCSGAEKLRASVAIGLALNPKLKLMLIRDGSLLDEEGMGLLADLAAAAGAQVLIERVDTGNEVGVRIVDGKTVEEIMSGKAWDCHDWTNCPMAEAFGIKRESDGPPLLLPRIRQFVRLFDARLIVAEKDAAGNWSFKPAPYTPPADAPWAKEAAAAAAAAKSD